MKCRLTGIQKLLNEDDQRPVDDFQEPLGLNDAQHHAADPEQVIKDPEPVIATTSGFISPFHISPPSKADRVTSSKCKSRKAVSEHITSSLYKKMLAETYTEKATCKTKMSITSKLKSNKPHQKVRKTADCIQEKKRGAAHELQQCESSESEDDGDSLFILQ